MATNRIHLNPLVSAGLVAALALTALCACISQRRTDASSEVSPTTSWSDSAPHARVMPSQGTGSALEPSDTDDCPPRMPARLPDRQLVVPILMYHRIGDNKPWTPEISRRLTVSPEDFERQLRWLKRNDYRTITQKELWDALMCGERLGRKPVLITMDDGYRNNYTYASPIIERLGMNATAYVITERISTNSSFLEWKHLPKLERRGVEVASHTVSHRALTTLSDRDALRELVASRRILERKLGHRIPWLSYPIGDHDARIVRLARQAGYLLATTTVWGARQSASRPLQLSRFRVLDSTHVGGIAAMLASAR
jgi:peptidoglycan/xylan/chitin deacetylase (PgdA/CDA1 family)